MLTLVQLENLTHMSGQTIEILRKQGWSDATILETAGCDPALADSDTQAYTISELSKLTGYSEETIESSVDISRSLDTGVRKNRTHNRTAATTYTYNGETLTRAQWSRKLGIPIYTLRRREELGWSVPRILGLEEAPFTTPVASKPTSGHSTPPEPQKPRESSLEPSRLRLLAQEHGIKYNTLQCRLHAGWSLEDALNKPVMASYIHVVDGQRYSAAQISKKFGISQKTYHYRLRRGMTPDEAATTPVAPNDIIRITHNGQTLTAKEWSKITGIKRATILWRHRKGWSTDRIFSHPQSKLLLETTNQ